MTAALLTRQPKEITMTKFSAAILVAILAAARQNPAITSAGLLDEMERGAIDGWRCLDAVRYGTFADWTAAMCKAAEELARLEAQKTRAQERRDAMFERTSMLNAINLD